MLERMAGENQDVHEGLWGQGVEAWLTTEVAAAFDELRADPSQAVAGDQVRSDLAARHAERVEDRGRA